MTGDTGRAARSRGLWWWIGGGLCVAVVAVLMLGGEEQTSHGQAEDQSDPTFYFRVYADVAFDGEPVVFDEILACRGFAYKSASGVPNRSYKLSAAALGRRLSDGGGLFMSAPSPCFFVNRYINQYRRGHERGRPLEEIEAPDNYLPYFFWADDADNPTVMEGYISEIYYDQPYARLKINEVKIGPFTDQVPDGRTVLDDYINDPNPMNVFTLRMHARFRSHPMRRANWYGHALFPIREDEWRTSPTLVAALNGIQPEDGLYNVPKDTREAGMGEIEWPASSAGLSSRVAANRHQMLIRPGSGVPRYHNELSVGTGADSPGHGLLTTTINPELFFALRRVEEVVPMDCAGNRCLVLQDRRGYYQFQLKKPGPNPIDTVVYQGAEISVEYGLGMLYDPKTGMLWLISNETI